jgi:tetratricopeptide (TPR) repeat protein
MTIPMQLNARSFARVLVVAAILFVHNGCFLPWIGSNGGDEKIISVFDSKSFLEVHEYDFPEYKWNNSAKFAEEMYATTMADYYFTKQYNKSLELLESARKVYPKDARIYVRMIECFARMGRIEAALNTIEEAETELNGFSRINGIPAYHTQLSKALESSKSEMEKEKRPLWKKILFAPAKLWPF